MINGKQSAARRPEGKPGTRKAPKAKRKQMSTLDLQDAQRQSRHHGDATKGG